MLGEAYDGEHGDLRDQIVTIIGDCQSPAGPLVFTAADRILAAVQQYVAGLETWTEWRISGDAYMGSGRYGPYEFVWSKYAGPANSRDDPEAAARAFLAQRDRDPVPWRDVALTWRTVTRTPWEQVAP